MLRSFVAEILCSNLFIKCHFVAVFSLFVVFPITQSITLIVLYKAFPVYISEHFLEVHKAEIQV